MFEAEQLCDRIAIMDQGRIIAIDTPDGLKRMLVSEHVTEIVAANLDPSIDRCLAALPAVRAVDVEIDETEARRGVIHLRSDDVALITGRVLAELKARGVDVISMTTGEPTLEDVFFELTRKGLR
jgi:ABC-2 type transport system ATP-binding protein